MTVPRLAAPPSPALPLPAGLPRPDETAPPAPPFTPRWTVTALFPLAVPIALPVAVPPAPPVVVAPLPSTLPPEPPMT
jgi:hypothetical protein